MKRIEYKTKERWTPSHYSPHKNIVVHYKGKRYELESMHGSGDSVFVFRGENWISVLSVNYRLPYVGLAEYNLDSEPEIMKDRGSHYDEMIEYPALTMTSDLFLQGSEQVEEILGPKGVDLAEITMVKRLQEYLPY